MSRARGSVRFWLEMALFWLKSQKLFPRNPEISGFGRESGKMFPIIWVRRVKNLDKSRIYSGILLEKLELFWEF
jgi:hypothetical protein